ncbi:MAG TPA: glycoside hydrolase family 2 TIM barrel-domain containing protein, partial [Polyangiaceae bacterium]|nr:glycoside hydrolase family 2 TIM barrel-domain containing protein [Polyangiaceae bacterium]
MNDRWLRALRIALLASLAGCSSGSPNHAGGTEATSTLAGTTSSGGPGATVQGVTSSGTTVSSTAGAVTTTGGGAVSSGSVMGTGGANTATDGGLTTGGAGGMPEQSPRTRTSVNAGWRFTKNDPTGAPDLSYAATKQWVLPTGNAFLAPEDRVPRPEGVLGQGVPYIATDFDDSSWDEIDLPHDSAIVGPYTDQVSSSMGRLPSPGVSWYRKKLVVPANHTEQSVFLDIDGAMQYSLVWVNGQFVGGWPYGYASYRLDVTDFVNAGEENVIAIRLVTPTPADANWDSGSSRWYPGAGIYRNVWLTTATAVHVAHWGTFVTTPEISSTEAAVKLDVTVDNASDTDVSVNVGTEIYELDAAGQRGATPVASLAPADLAIAAGSSTTAATAGSIQNPKLWGVPPSQTPNLYVATTTIRQGERVVDVYHTTFGVRSIPFDGEGFRLNGELLKMDGVCLHHDLGALGAAISTRARERQLEIMQEMGSNAVRTSHNPFEPEFYDLADHMGFLVMDEAFDVWSTGKAELDHHQFFEEWYQQDLRAFIRRDRNHPSVVMWSIGNEIPEQQDASNGPARAEELTDICHEEDPTRPTVSGMNRAEPADPFSGPIDTIGLNYQGTGVRDLGAQYPTYHAAFPDKFIVGTETTSTFSTRGTYLFPVTSSRGTPATGSSGVDAQAGIISSYDLYHADWSYSPDEEFESQDKWPYVGG